MSNDRATANRFSAVRLFGSVARGDADATSDRDVLVVAPDDFLRTARAQEYIENLRAQFDDVSVYGRRRFEQMHLTGHLFAWHVYQESIQLRPSSDEVESPDLVTVLERPTPYTNAVVDSEELLRVLADCVAALRQNATSTFEAGVMYVVARNLGVIATAISGEPSFSPAAPFIASERARIAFPLERASYDLLRQCRKASSMGRLPPAIDAPALTRWVTALAGWSQEMLGFVRTNQGQSMSHRFRLKTLLEREVLSLVNAELPWALQLPGLSPRAVSDWASRLPWETSLWDRHLLVGLLDDIGACCQSMSDQSRSAFDPSEFDEVEIRRRVDLLAQYLCSPQVCTREQSERAGAAQLSVEPDGQPRYARLPAG